MIPRLLFFLIFLAGCILFIAMPEEVKAQQAAPVVQHHSFESPDKVFSFTYPLLSNWRVASTNCENDSCRIYVQEEKQEKLEPAPFLSISTTAYQLDAAQKKKLPKNKHGIFYDDSKRKQNQQSTIFFYLADHRIQMTLVPLPHRSPVSRELLFDELIKTFEGEKWTQVQHSIYPIKISIPLGWKAVESRDTIIPCDTWEIGPKGAEQHAVTLLLGWLPRSGMLSAFFPGGRDPAGYKKIFLISGHRVTGLIEPSFVEGGLILIDADIGKLALSIRAGSSEETRKMLSSIKVHEAAQPMKEICCPQCPQMHGFQFEYPIFENWEVKAKECKSVGTCILWLNHPKTIEFEVAPRMTIHKLPLAKLGLAEFSQKENAREKVTPLHKSAKKNPAGIRYDFVYDPSQYIEGHIPEASDWDYLQFYGKDFGVRIIPFTNEGAGYSTRVFIKEVIRSFRFTSEQTH